jgi:hypothetical protein
MHAAKIGAFLTKRIIRKTPGWAEVTYLRQASSSVSERQLLLLLVFALLEKQYGFALEITETGIKQYKSPLFKECQDAVWSKINAEKLKTPLVILKRQFNKLFSQVHD